MLGPSWHHVPSDDGVDSDCTPCTNKSGAASLIDAYPIENHLRSMTLIGSFTFQWMNRYCRPAKSDLLAMRPILGRKHGIAMRTSEAMYFRSSASGI